MLNRIGLTFVRFLKEEGFKESPIALDKMKQLSEDILAVIEREGMLPPCNSPVGRGDFNVDECTSDHVYDCKWENENG
jgi:hypothetical protein